MIKILNYSDCRTQDVLNRDIRLESGVEDTIRKILTRVQQAGDRALLDYAEQFDGVRLEQLQVTEEELESAYVNEDPAFLRVLEHAKRNIEAFHRRQLRNNFMLTGEDGVVMGQRILPLARVGLYVPGGTASYPSSVLMNAVPAVLAGVQEIVMVTPPDKNGNVPASILAAAKIAGVTRIFKTGGAQAVAALAFGTESIPKVDKIVGPGNVFVATAKRMVYGLVDIDMIAGPSEILILADASCNPRYIAADLLSQAEHDKLASAVLITDSTTLAQAVAEALEHQLRQLPRQEIARTSIDTNGKIIITESMRQAVEISNQIAPEHLELCVDDPFALLHLVKHAGSVFLGKYAPEALGDYIAGPNHTLPTAGTARFSSPLSVDDFVKKSSYLYYTHGALAKVKDDIVAFAGREGLEAHGRSVSVRFEE